MLENPGLGPDLGLLGSNLRPKKFFWRFQFYWKLDVVPSCNPVQYREKRMMQT